MSRLKIHRWAGPLLFVALLGLLQVVPVSTGGSPAFGQASASPTPGGPTIQFLNPTQGTSAELSTKTDTKDTMFHLVAWVSELPSSAAVEFKYKPSTPATAQELTIGTGVQVGPDTFEFSWDLAGAGPEANDEFGAQITEGTSGTLKAILASNGTEVARDEEVVRINQQTPPACPPPDANNNRGCEDEAQANTVELTYPLSGGPLGYYRPNPQQGPVNTVLDVLSSEGTANVQAFYTLSRPGTEPQWKACKAGAGTVNETKANTADGVRCEYDPADNATRVTAVAVRAMDTHQSVAGSTTDIDTADAHRVVPYEQDAASIKLLPETQEFESGKCAPVITATVLDQAQPARKIADINVDVHAAGPTDSLSFDDSNGTYSSSNKAPEGHPSEAAIDCETAANPGFSESQGEHESPNEPDIKHIESLNDTDDAGSWKFALYSPDEGGTRFQVFADEDGNDRFCSSEAAATGSIGWDTTAPAPEGFAAEDTSCPRPLPSGASPSPTSSPSPAVSATSTPVPQEQRTVTLAAEEDEATVGEMFRFSGQLFSPQGLNCIDNEFIEITRRAHGTRSAVPVTTAHTNSNGRFQVEIKAKGSADYQATAPSHDVCAAAYSSPVPTEVAVKVSINANDRTPARFGSMKISAGIRPAHPGAKVVLQRKVFGRWIQLATKKLNSNSVAVFKVETGFKVQNFRAKWKSQDNDHLGNVSSRLHIETHMKSRK